MTRRAPIVTSVARKGDAISFVLSGESTRPTPVTRKVR
jgi:hypothetical protein